MESLADRIAQIQDRIDRAARAAQRDPQAVRLIGVSKTFPMERVAEALAAGLRDFGESRIQEAEAKILGLPGQGARWHLIGHLQSNKAKRAAALFDCLHSVDSLRLAQAISRHVQEAGQPPREALLQVNVSGESSKEGFDLAMWQDRPAAAQGFFADVAQTLALPGLRITGLMTIAPYGDDPLPTFRAARLLREELARRFPAAPWAELSMGMSEDFEAAIAEGATMVRVGRAIFGQR